MTIRFRSIAVLVLGGTGSLAAAQDFAGARIVPEPIAGDLTLLVAQGEGVVVGNILASVGESGVLLVDDQQVPLTPKVRSAVAALGGQGIDFVINTHWHFDHAEGNQGLAPDGVWFVAHENSRAMLMHDNKVNFVTQIFDQPASPARALPVVTYDDTMRMHFNGHRIELLHFGPAHTTGDTAVLFRDRNVVHMGDVFNTLSYPFIDADNGGSLEGVISFSEHVLAALEPDAIVIPGHGEVSNYDGLVAYIAMLKTIRDRMSSLIRSGASLEQVKAARPTSDWDAKWGDPTTLIDRAYASMTR
jgi:cyclase